MFVGMQVDYSFLCAYLCMYVRMYVCTFKRSHYERPNAFRDAMHAFEGAKRKETRTQKNKSGNERAPVAICFFSRPCPIRHDRWSLAPQSLFPHPLPPRFRWCIQPYPSIHLAPPVRIWDVTSVLSLLWYILRNHVLGGARPLRLRVPHRIRSGRVEEPVGRGLRARSPIGPGFSFSSFPLPSLASILIKTARRR